MGAGSLSGLEVGKEGGCFLTLGQVCGCAIAGRWFFCPQWIQPHTPVASLVLLKQQKDLLGLGKPRSDWF